eukprot:TRINITY_DN651_c0_g1_i2.p1 TRINITY_DN651_c0_g1~~TRINITY_DN651_c0_g1_i2.p1  ORF type:complete len:1343 (+),score=160.31 TRINITY_DN651_c0_g1_i2:89-4117(+)
MPKNSRFGSTLKFEVAALCLALSLVSHLGVPCVAQVANDATEAAYEGETVEIKPLRAVPHSPAPRTAPAGYRFYGGDMLVPEKPATTKIRPQFWEFANPWPNPDTSTPVPYDASNFASNVDFSNMIHEAIAEIQNKTCIRFVQRTAQPNYIKFVSTSAGCFAPVGWNTGASNINIQAGQCDRGAIVHEICHTLGIMHTMQRPDRDNNILIDWANLDPALADQYQIENDISMYLPVGPYDHGSIMHYGYDVAAVNGQDLTTVYAPRTIGQSQALSAQDVQELDFIYTSCKLNTPKCMTNVLPGATVGLGEGLKIHFFVNERGSTQFSHNSVTATFTLPSGVTGSVASGASVPTPSNISFVITPSLAQLDTTITISVTFKSSKSANSVTCSAALLVVPQVDRLECFGKLATDPTVCGSDGKCVLRDTCKCNGKVGPQCNLPAGSDWNKVGLAGPYDGLPRSYSSSWDAAAWSTVPFVAQEDWTLDVDPLGLLEFELRSVVIPVHLQTAATLTFTLMYSNGTQFQRYDAYFPASDIANTRASWAVSSSGFGNLPVTGILRISTAANGLWRFGTAAISTGKDNTASGTVAPKRSFFRLIGVIRCKDGHYGSRCASVCPGGSGVDQCYRHGLCQDGVVGTGLCRCFGNWNPATNCQTCLAKYTGPNCADIAPTYCTATSCANGGTCTEAPQTKNFTCSCLPGWEGPTCSQMTSLCQPQSPCKNGQCTAVFLNYTCSCSPGWTGRNCDINIDDCAPNPCENGGTCTDKVNDFSCTCPSTYSGKTCTVWLSPCESYPCKNGGTCSAVGSSFECNCAAGYSGTLCENDVLECNSTACKNGGTCLEINGPGIICDCPAAWTGPTCETAAAVGCSPNPCLNNGNCTATTDGFTCQCPSGYLGKMCETAPDPCTPQPCYNGGSCTPRNTQYYRCNCTSGWSGADCRVGTAGCTANYCQNGGACRTTAGGALYCDCPTGFTGTTCETNINDCADSPCARGTCTDLVNAFKCQCPANWTGQLCDVAIDQCAKYPCKNGGTCTGYVDSYSCSCPPEWEGTTCEVVVTTDCNNSPCLNGGTCTVGTNGGYTCTCLSGHVGKNCEMPVDPCTQLQPCLHNGTCTAPASGIFVCTCPAGWTGDTCQTADPCGLSPCNSGKCSIDSTGSVVCTCPDGYKGNFCQDDMRSANCNQQPCANSGTCLSTASATLPYTCQCTDLYTGTNCQLFKSSTGGGVTPATPASPSPDVPTPPAEPLTPVSPSDADVGAQQVGKAPTAPYSGPDAMEEIINHAVVFLVVSCVFAAAVGTAAYFYSRWRNVQYYEAKSFFRKKNEVPSQPTHRYPPRQSHALNEQLLTNEV